MPCTGAGLLRCPRGSNLPPTSRSSRCSTIPDPVVYTPVTTSGRLPQDQGIQQRRAEQAAASGLFFPRPRDHMGRRKKAVLSRAKVHDPAHPADAQFVENVMWTDSRVVFVALSMPARTTTVPWAARSPTNPRAAAGGSRAPAADFRWLGSRSRAASAPRPW
jgi:hypothetical protein